MKSLVENVSADVSPLPKSVSRRWIRPGGEEAEHGPVESWWKPSQSTRRRLSTFAAMEESREDEHEASRTPLPIVGKNLDRISEAIALISTWMGKQEQYNFYYRPLRELAEAPSGAWAMEEGQFDYRPATSLVPGRGPHSRDILTSPDDPSRFPSEREGIRWSDSEMLMGRFLIDIGELENWSGRLGTITNFHIPSTKESFEQVRIWSDFETSVWCQQIARSTTCENVLMILRRAGLESVGARVRDLAAMEAEESDSRTISLGSLKELARFLVSERKLGVPSIGVSPDGLAHAQWRIPENGMLTMQFYATGDIRFAAISRPFQPGFKRDVIYGTMSKEKTLEAIRGFTVLLES